jgi:hypothetical protein
VRWSMHQIRNTGSEGPCGRRDEARGRVYELERARAIPVVVNPPMIFYVFRVVSNRRDRHRGAPVLCIRAAARGGQSIGRSRGSPGNA